MKTKDPWVAIASRYPEGARIEGRVTRILDYGCSVEIEDGVEGFLHVTDMHWTNKKMHPSKIVNVGDLVEVMVLNISEERRRISLGLKQCKENPWVAIAARYPEGARIEGRVTKILDYGCSVEIEDGVEGFVFVSEMHWTNKNMHPSKVVNVGDLVQVMVLNIDEDRGRFELGIKQCQDNPWVLFANTHKKNDKVSGKISSITAFGIFIDLEDGVSGLVHLSDISWDTRDEEALHDFKKGDDIEAVVLYVDAERERISLSI